jgi:FkbM family methyltransferase
LLIPIALESGSRHVIAFEPSPRNHHLLTMNVALNGLDFVEIHQLAAGDREGIVRFSENLINSGNSHVSENGEVQVQVSRLDTVLSSQAKIDLLVMDTEGFEVHAMRGGKATLEKTRHFYVEYAPEQLREQGSEPQEFLDLVADRFSSMYLASDQMKFFPDRSYISFLRTLPSQRGLLLNLLFSDDTSAREELAV